MDTGMLADLDRRTDQLREEGLFKSERVIASPQDAHITLEDGSEVLNFCANNYLGLADHPALVEAAKQALSELRLRDGLGAVHLWHPDRAPGLERRLAEFLGMEDAILYSSCFDANTGLFETILDEQDAVISDALNHASIIDGVRLCKARRLRYANNDMADLELRLEEAAAARYRLIATDGVFSMDGVVANLPAICDLAEAHGAMVMVDDSHAVGFVGEHGRGTPELTGTLGTSTSSPAPSARRSVGPRAATRPGQGRGDRLAPPALPALPVLEQPRPRHRRHLDPGPRPARRVRRVAGPAAAQRRAIPGGHGPRRFHPRRGGPSDHPGDAGRRPGRRRWPPASSNGAST
jgi:hypothetical protein